MDRITACRDYLLNLRRTKTRVAALPGHIVPQSMAEGYSVQERVVSVLLAKNGGKAIGYKIACTSELAQKALGVDGPFFGVLMSATTFASGATLKGDDYLVRCAEAEFGFEMADDVPEGGPTRRCRSRSSLHRRSHRSRSSITATRTGRWWARRPC
jgi:2-keto-4-pentenoate hydratase